MAVNVILQDSSVNFNRVDMGLLSKAAVNIEGIVQEGIRLSWVVNIKVNNLISINSVDVVQLTKATVKMADVTL